MPVKCFQKGWARLKFAPSVASFKQHLHVGVLLRRPVAIIFIGFQLLNNLGSLPYFAIGDKSGLQTGQFSSWTFFTMESYVAVRCTSWMVPLLTTIYQHNNLLQVILCHRVIESFLFCWCSQVGLGDTLW